MRLTRMLLCLAALSLSHGAFAQEEPGPEAAALLKRVESLDEQGKIDDALALLDQGLTIYTEPNYDRYFTLNYKFILLARLNRLEDAVKVAEEKANIIKSPKQAINVAESYLKVGNPGKALEWVGESVDRGLQSYTIFAAEIYEPLRGNPQFASYIEMVKKRAWVPMDLGEWSMMAKGGARLAPFHGFEKKLPESVINEVKDLEKKIFNGTFRVPIDEQPPVSD